MSTPNPPPESASPRPAAEPGRSRVVVVSSNKGGVGKTTVTANLAVYLRALREDLPVLVVGLDDQTALDRMFSLGPLPPGAENLKHGWAARNLRKVIRFGQYGVHFVPSPPDTAMLKGRAEDPRLLARILRATAWDGIVLIDTKSDLEALTRNAYHAADRIIVPVADRASLLEAEKVFRILEQAKLGARARILFTLVDARSRGQGGDLASVLKEEVERRGWPSYPVHLSRSPRVESLGSADGRPLSVLHDAKGTAVFRQLRALAEEVLHELDLDGPSTSTVPAGAVREEEPIASPFRADDSDSDSSAPDWKAALLRGVWRREVS